MQVAALISELVWKTRKYNVHKSKSASIFLWDLFIALLTFSSQISLFSKTHLQVALKNHFASIFEMWFYIHKFMYCENRNMARES